MVVHPATSMHVITLLAGGLCYWHRPVIQYASVVEMQLPLVDCGPRSFIVHV